MLWFFGMSHARESWCRLIKMACREGVFATQKPWFFTLVAMLVKVIVFQIYAKAKNYKAFVWKYKAHILKYVPYVFFDVPKHEKQVPKRDFSERFEVCREAMVRADKGMKKSEVGFCMCKVMFGRAKCWHLHDFWCYYTAMLSKTFIFAHGENSVQ